MLKKFTSLFVLSCLILSVYGQNEAIVQEGELGISVGAGHYFGDINNQSRFNNAKPVMGVFFRKQFGGYVALRLSGHYADLGYSDKYSNIEFQKRRNLSFESKIWEMSVQGDFNFFRFIPGDPYYFFTPYITMGVGSFNYDPFTYLNGEKYYLRKLGTEGQGSKEYPDRKPYSNQAFCFPLGMGIKYNLFKNVNLAFEVSYRFTNTDYLDDVSSTYAGDIVFPTPAPGKESVAYLLQDRSYETGPRIGVGGKQRGFSEQKDQYLFAELAISISFSSYKCANPR
jgi:opacity protein-like surface antigen